MTTRSDRRGRPTRAEQRARVEALISEALARGWVEVGAEAAPYISPTDERVVEHVPLGPGWARYTLRLEDGTLVLEGGARRVWIVPQSVASTMVTEAARRAVERATTLHHLLELLLRATLGGAGRTPVERAISDGGFVAILRERVRERAPVETQRLVEPELRALLASVVSDEAVLKRLTGDRSLSAEVLASIGQASPRPDLAAALEREIADRLAAGAVALDASVVGSVARDAASVGGGRRWWAYGVRLADGSLHLEGGARRMRVLEAPDAARLLDARVAEAIAGSDLRLLLHLRACARDTHQETDLHRALATRPADLAALDARIRALAPNVAVDPPLGPDAASMLAAAGVDEATVRRLRHARELPPDELMRLELRAREPRLARSASATLDALIDQRVRSGWVELREDAPYLSSDDPQIAEILPAGASGWARHVAILRDGSLHMEGGLTRVRLCPSGVARALVDSRAAALLDDDNLHRLLHTATRAAAAPPEGTAIARLARGRGRDKLLSRLRTVAEAASPGVRIARRADVELLRQAGVSGPTLARLAGDPSLDLEHAAARTGAVARPPASDRLANLIADRAAKGWVEVHEDVAPYLYDGDPAIVERISPRAVPWTRLIAVLGDGSLHLEGGGQRVRMCAPARAAKLMDEAAQGLLRSDDLLVLLDVAVRARRHPSKHTLCYHLNTSPTQWSALLARIREVSREAHWEGRVQRRSWQEILALAGVDAMRRLFLEGTVHHAPEAARGQGAAGGAEHAAAVAKARLLSLLSERIGAGWVTLPTGAVPYVGEHDPRVRELFRDPDADHRFAALLEDGTIVHEGGTKRWWLVPPDRVGEVVERHAWETARAGDVHGLLDLLLAAGSAAASHHPLTALVAARADLRRSIEDRIRAAARSGRSRFTRTEHLELLRALGVVPRGAAAPTT